MTVRTLVLPDRYADSVSLMAVSAQLAAMPGVSQVAVAMATPLNKEQWQRVGLLTPEAEAAGPMDLVIAVAGRQAAAAVRRASILLSGTPVGASAGASDSVGPSAGAPAGATPAAGAPRTIRAAAAQAPDARVALISVPGAYAAYEARQALEAGLDVMLYSDNVPLEDEVRLKRLAHDKGRLLMGPDCGTAMLGGIGLGFANAVRPGPVGLVAASGTGAQEVACLVHRLGSGVSAIIGTGGRDLTAAVGGLMTLDGLRRLEEDPQTEVIVLISKQPDPQVAEQIRAVVGDCRKPVVTCFVGGPVSLDQAAVEAVAIATGENPADLEERLGYRWTPGAPGGRPPGSPAGAPASRLRRALPKGRSKVHGLFSGGTLCQQARALLGPHHSLLDLGDDLYTVGRPHPMIDPTLRAQSLVAAAADPETAVILIDLVLGHGAHPDPAGALAPAIRQAVRRGVPVVASITGVDEDPQGLAAQTAALQAAGAQLFPTARLAALAVADAIPDATPKGANPDAGDQRGRTPLRRGAESTGRSRAADPVAAAGRRQGRSGGRAVKAGASPAGGGGQPGGAPDHS